MCGMPQRDVRACSGVHTSDIFPSVAHTHHTVPRSCAPCGVCTLRAKGKVHAHTHGHARDTPCACPNT
eukprot:scaffold36090_cov140-Isochrysis_galbana.AAC.2